LLLRGIAQNSSQKSLRCDKVLLQP
ncbi:ygbB family protein, partial [Chlamydia psittaci 06-1683]